MNNYPRNVCLVKIFNPLQPQTSPSIGIGYLLKSLSKVDEIQPIFLDCHLERLQNDDLIQKLKEYDPLIVGFQVFSIDYYSFVKLLPEVRRALPNSTIVAGGPHVSGIPEHTLSENRDLDYIIKAEGEYALSMLARYLLMGNLEGNLSKIPNLAYRSNGEFVQNPVQWVDIKAQGAPAWDLLKPDRYPPFQHGGTHKGDRVAPILTSRGCPYPCTYCAGHLLTGKKIRLRDVEDIGDELELLSKKYGINEFLIEDENFTFYREHALAFAEEVKRRQLKCYFSFPNGLRMDKLDAGLIAKLKEIGTYRVNVGLESGSLDTLRRVKKEWDLDACIEVIKLLKKNGIEVRGFFILGFPDETANDMRQTVQLALRSGVDTAYFSNFLPLPGTESFNLLLNKGEITLQDINWKIFSAGVGQYPYSPQGTSPLELGRIIRRAYLRFYLRPRQIMLVLRYLTSIHFIKGLLFSVSALFSSPRSDDRQKHG